MWQRQRPNLCLLELLEPLPEFLSVGYGGSGKTYDTQSYSLKPLVLQTDQGTGLKNDTVQKLLKEEAIHFFTTYNVKTKNASSELSRLACGGTSPNTRPENTPIFDSSSCTLTTTPIIDTYVGPRHRCTERTNRRCGRNCTLQSRAGRDRRRPW